MKPKLNQKQISIAAAIVIVLAVILVINFKAKRNANESPYSVVYLTTGDVYIGHLRTFPTFEMTDAYLFQVTKDPTDPNKNSFQLNPVKESLWAPAELNISRRNVVFYGPLLKTSKIAETIAGQAK